MNESTGKIENNNGLAYLEWRIGKGETIEIFDILVNSERRMGTGTNLINELKDKFPNKRLYLFTRESNEIAHKFYSALGFKFCRLENFYKDGDDNARIYYK